MKRRASGILLHVTSLPSRFGIGDMGPEAYRFVDFLSQTKQSYWQILPLNPTEPVHNHTPYTSASAFAGNPLLISPEVLVEEGLLDAGDLAKSSAFPVGRVDYPAVVKLKRRLVARAFANFKNQGADDAFERFCAEHAWWLVPHALFVALKGRFREGTWGDWPIELRDRHPEALSAAEGELSERIELENFLQFIFFTQWETLKRYCGEKGIKLIGDVPIYVNYDSVDVWGNPGLFKLDDSKKPYVVAGVPPDYFSKTGQRWGNPLYRWEVLRETQHDWWAKRIGHTMRLVDFVRIDHFRGLVGYWEIPASEETAINGCWVEAPAMEFFTHLQGKFPYLPVIAEDLGTITPDVCDVMSRFQFPGMKILLFAFGPDMPTNPYIPHNLPANCVAYTGTHDNNTARGWFETEAYPEDKARIFRYLGREVSAGEFPRELIRLLMRSAANTVIIPLQDVLGLGADARMNTPSTIAGNWEWRLDPALVTADVSGTLREMTEIYGRTA